MSDIKASPGGIKVLVVDDTLLYRLLVKEAVEKLPGYKVVGMAENGKVALEKIETLNPDLVLLDIEMPVMNGLELLDALKKTQHKPTVLVISSITKQGGKVALQAMDKGAADFLTKPQRDSVEESRAALFAELDEKLRPLDFGSNRVARRDKVEQRIYRGARESSTAVEASTDVAAARSALHKQRIEAICIGVSTGGPQALTELLPKLPLGLPPILIVQHMPGPFISALAEKLDGLCALTVREAQHEMPIERNHIYIAPGGWQMRIAKHGVGLTIVLRDDPAENHCLPAADYLFRGVVETLGRRILGIVLTGMGNDGAKGLLQIREAGGLGIAQNEETCTVFGMPKQAIKIGGADYVLSLTEIGEAIKALAA